MLQVKVLGSGCPSCQKLEKLCFDVAAEHQLPMDFEKISDFTQFADYGVMFTPGLIINGKVKSSGKIPTRSTLAHWMTEANAE